MFPDFDEETCKRIDASYYEAFPGIKQYHQWCFELGSQPYATNLYDVKYYGANGHHLRNILVQGTSAYMTKDRQAAVTKYLKEKGYKSKFVMPIHDEVQFLIHKDDPLEMCFELQKIMQDVGSPVPIVSDMEITFTNWKEKEEVHNVGEIEALRDRCRPIR